MLNGCIGWRVQPVRTCHSASNHGSSGPGWVLDAWLLAKVYTPNLGAMNWMLVCQRIQPWLPLSQASALVGGTAMLYRWYRSTAISKR
jgi:hypothetical protein